MDGSEEGNTVPAAILSGAPTDLQARTVRYAITGPIEVLITKAYISESTDQPNQPNSPVTGMAAIGAWTGTYCRKDTVGRTPLWVGNHPEISCKAHT